MTTEQIAQEREDCAEWLFDERQRRRGLVANVEAALQKWRRDDAEYTRHRHPRGRGKTAAQETSER